MNNIFPRSINKTDPGLQPSACNHIPFMFQALVQWTSRCNVLERRIRRKGSSRTHERWYKVEMTMLSCGWCKSYQTFLGGKAVAGRQTVYSYLAAFIHGETKVQSTLVPRADGPSMKVPRIASGALGRRILEVQVSNKQHCFSASSNTCLWFKSLYWLCFSYTSCYVMVCCLWPADSLRAPKVTSKGN